jgi:phosphatidylinositol-3-phosphatase
LPTGPAGDDRPEDLGGAGALTRSRRIGIIAFIVLVSAVASLGYFAQGAGRPSASAPTGRNGQSGALPSATLTPIPAATPTQTVASTAPTSRPTTAPTPTPTLPPPGVVPTFNHVYTIVMENEEATSIIGNASAPYINGLARTYGLATNYTAVSHPSEPNYLALWSGSTQGVTDDGVYNFSSGTTLADQIETAGRSWHVAAQNVPLGCSTAATASGGEDGSGNYARKHEPAISWTSVSGNPVRCANITDFSHFDPNVGNYWFIAPNLCNDMHDCSIATGDAYLATFIPKILSSAAFADGGVLFLTWDEGSSGTGGGGKVVTIIVSPLGKPAFSSATAHTHYSLVRTVEDSWAMPCLANACTANSLAEFFK